MIQPTEEEIIRDIEERIANGTEMDGFERVKARVPKEPRAVFSVRMSSAELRTIGTAAAERGQTIGDFIRMAAMAAASGQMSSRSIEQATILNLAIAKMDELHRLVDGLRDSDAKAG